MTKNSPKTMTKTTESRNNNPDILEQLGEWGRSQVQDPHLGILDDLEAVSEGRATREATARLDARAEKSGEWADAVEAAQPISIEMQEIAAERVIHPNVFELRRRRNRRLGSVAGIVTAAAAAAVMLVPQPQIDPLPEYTHRVEYGPSNHSQFIELARTKDGEVIDKGRSRFKIQLTPDVQTSDDVVVHAWSVGAKTESVFVETTVSGKGGVRITLDSHRSLEHADYLLLTLRRSGGPEPKTPLPCDAPSCRVVRVNVQSGM